MIINRIGSTFQYEGITYTLGDKIVATNESEYEGLYGIIKEIRTGDDRETENDTPDMYCEFFPPFDEKEISALESRFSCLYRCPKKLDDIILDEVIMAPEMIRLITPASSTRKINGHLVVEEWIFNGECDCDSTFLLEEEQARHHLAELIHQEQTEGHISEWSSNPCFRTTTTPLFYEAWLEDSYCENHYKAYVLTQDVLMSQELFDSIGRRYVENMLRQQFAMLIEGWEELEGLTKNQIADLVASVKVPQIIQSKLKNNHALIDAYWDSISEASYELLKKHIESLK